MVWQCPANDVKDICVWLIIRRSTVVGSCPSDNCSMVFYGCHVVMDERGAIDVGRAFKLFIRPTRHPQIPPLSTATDILELAPMHALSIPLAHHRTNQTNRTKNAVNFTKTRKFNTDLYDGWMYRSLYTDLDFDTESQRKEGEKRSRGSTKFLIRARSVV